ncbi:MAG: sodium:alanine symporter family protein [Blastochloris viridis]|uniref:Sodium:alanine symporter family protein n=1 Tax=Blastochloris viridis TaxID=1079 RepID=A0A6N4RBF6_BLAVI|nr:MAG: sodium:alanine symporter family protein [Blastochloris viridis]
MFTTIHDALNYISSLLWGWPMLILLMGTGIWLTILLKGLQFSMLIPAMKDALFPAAKPEGEGTISNRSALMTALAATVGTGNIAGVATAVVIGGPGAVFWMWCSGLFGMALKYSETLLGVHYRVKTAEGAFQGGPMYYLMYGARQPVLGALYALFLAFAAFSIGAMVQSNSVADAMKSSFNISPTLTGTVMTLAAAAILFGGLKSIAKMADRVVPFMILLYAVSGTLILLANAAYVPQMFYSIFQSAFTGTAATGGFVGASIMMAMRYGLARGVFANESGLGSAAIVAATAQTKHPTEQALISMTQTFIDTFFVCTFTALVILVTGAWTSPDVASGGASLTQLAFSSGLGGIDLFGFQLGSAIVALCLLLFAFTTVLGWGYYGQQGAVFLFGKGVATPYMVAFLLMTFFGAAVLDLAETVNQGVQFIWTIADITTGLMMIPNLLAMWLLSGKIRNLTNDYLKNHRYGKPLEHAAFHFTAPKPAFVAPQQATVKAPAKAAAPVKAAPKKAVKKPARKR